MLKHSRRTRPSWPPSLRLRACIPLGLACGLLLSAPIALAQETGAPDAASDPAQEAVSPDDPLVTDRPDATESPVAVRPGRMQLESGYTMVGIDDARLHTLGEVLLRIGVVERLELRLGLNSYAWLRDRQGGTVSGLTDTSIGLKYQFHDGGSSAADPTMALLASTTLPTGADELSLQVAEPSLRLAAAWALSDRISLGGNLGWGYLQDGAAGERFSELAASLSLGYGISDRWGAFLEYFGFYPTGDHGPSANFVDTGLTYGVTGDLQLDARFGYGLNRDADDFFVGVGTAVRW